MIEVRDRIPKWEVELWQHLSNGNGDKCPIYNCCQIRRKGGWCISNNLVHLQQLLESPQIISRNCSFLNYTTPGKIFKLVEMLAQSILRKARIHCPPVPSEIVSLVSEHPIEVRLLPLKAYHGAIWRLKEAWVIQLNENDTPSRRRFTLFHEVFHILAHSRATPVFKKRGTEIGSFNELLADYFACCILIPRQWVVEKWAEVNNLHRIAEIFDVSSNAMWLRLRTLHLIGNCPP